MTPADIIVIIVVLLIIGLVTAYLIHVKRRGGCAGCPYNSECKGGCNGSCGSSIKAAEGRDYSDIAEESAKETGEGSVGGEDKIEATED